MKILNLSGNHLRHLYFHEKIISNFDTCGILIYEREEALPEPPKGTSVSDKFLFNKHFKERDIAEKKYFKKITNTKFYQLKNHFVFNDNKFREDKNLINILKETQPDVVISFGIPILSKNILNKMPDLKFNFHLGLSPWYRGAATMFWPFYNMEPNLAGITIHKIISKVDAGDILHQSVPFLSKNDGIHDVSCKAIIKATNEFIKILKKIKNNDKILYKKQKNTGKIYLRKDFKPLHLRSVYKLNKNKIVNEYLNNKNKFNKVKIFKDNI